MTEIDSSWKKLETLSNATVYEIEPCILAIVPFPDAADDEKSARESLGSQAKHWKQVGHRGACVVYMDPMLAQDTGARQVYAKETLNHPTTCYALVGTTFFAQAASAVFTGLALPGRPTQIFSSLDAARPWIAEMNAAHGGKL